MDPTDVRIFCEMAFSEQGYAELGERHPGAAEVGKKLGLDEKTVRARVKKMEEAGFIKYYQASPSLALFGMRVLCLFRLEALNLSTKYAVISRLHEVPRLVESSDYLGPSLAVSVAGATPEEAEREASEVARRYELKVVRLGSSEVAQPSLRLNRLDWQIVRRLRYDAKSTDRSLADALSVTPRTVGYRLSKLLRSGAIQTKAVINPQRQAGLVFYELELLVDPPSAERVSRWLRERHGERLWRLRKQSPDIILARLFAFTLAEPEASANEALARDGVERCLLYILKEVIEPRRPNWIDSLIELRIASQSPPPGAPRSA